MPECRVTLFIRVSLQVVFFNSLKMCVWAGVSAFIEVKTSHSWKDLYGNVVFYSQFDEVNIATKSKAFCGNEQNGHGFSPVHHLLLFCRGNGRGLGSDNYIGQLTVLFRLNSHSQIRYYFPQNYSKYFHCPK